MPLPALISLYSPLIPIILFLLYFKSTKKTILWVFFIYSVYAFANDNTLIGIQNKYMQDPSQKYLINYNTILLQVFTLLEYLFFSIFFYIIVKTSILKKIILGFSILFSLFCIYFIVQKGVKHFDSIQTSVEGILIIIYSIFYFYEQMNSSEVTFIYQGYKFWIVLGIILYIAGNLFFFTYASTLPQELRNQYMIINYTCNTIKNLLFATAIYIQAKSMIEKPNLPDPFEHLN